MTKRWIGLPVVALSAALAWAGDAKTYDVDWREKWTVGQTVTATEHQTTAMDMTMNGKPFRSGHESVDAEWIVRCDAVDADGRATKRTVFFKAWKQVKDKQTDDSIAGVRVDVEGTQWKVAGDKTPGTLAKKWLDRKFAKLDDDDPFKTLMPPKMTLGEVWKPDPKAAAAAFAKSMEDAPIDVSGVQVEMKLTSVEGAAPNAVGTFEGSFHAPIASEVKGMPPGAKVAPSSAADAKFTHKGPLSSGLLGAEHVDMDMNMDVEVPAQGQTMAIATKVKMTEDLASVAGGEIPELPKPDAPAPDAPKPPK